MEIFSFFSRFESEGCVNQIFYFFFLEFQPVAAESDKNSGFSLFGLSPEESYVVIAAGVAVFMMLVVLFVIVLKKRHVRCRLSKGDKAASIELNTPSPPEVKPADVSINSCTPMLPDDSVISESSV